MTKKVFPNELPDKDDICRLTYQDGDQDEGIVIVLSPRAVIDNSGIALVVPIKRESGPGQLIPELEKATEIDGCKVEEYNVRWEFVFSITPGQLTQHLGTLTPECAKKIRRRISKLLE